ncbi:MAG: ABC transporter ATP-binding protein [Balneolaceae bacterium]|nr:ABC transporter ATP-binding protein [Balneolaceae bacterium]
MNAETPVLGTTDLNIGYRNRRGKDTIVGEEIEVTLHSGELICLLGPNGSGKSTLIRTLAGMQSPLAGGIELFGDPVSELSNKEIAKRLSTVLTERITIGNLTVYTLVAFGRSPYTGWLGTLSQQDKEKVHWALESTGLSDFAGRDISKLSDGERQKVMIARALAQDTSVILLDEPTAHLDLPNRVEIIRLLRKLAHETGKGILLSTHELDLALKAGDRIWLMNNEKDLMEGVPEDMVLDGTFEKAFARDSFDFDRATGSFNIHRKQDRKIVLEGDKVPVFWTERALEREGYRTVDRRDNIPAVHAEETKNGYRWMIIEGEERAELHSIQGLIEYLRTQKEQAISAGLSG